MGKEKYKATLPDGRKVNAHNGDRGFVLRQYHTLTCTEGIMYRLRGVKLADQLQLGKRGMNSFPDKLDVSKHHLDIACVNNYYFAKDAGSKRGTYIKMGSGKNKRIELHKGMTFAVGRVHLKVSNIEGDCADNRKIKAKLDEEAAERAANKNDSDKKEEVQLDEDEEFADDSDDEDGGKGGKKGKLEGPPVMFLNPLDKKSSVKGRIRETSTIGSDKEKNKIAVPADIAKEKKVDAVHTRIVLEDGHFYLEDAGSSFGTYVGFPKKKYFQIRGGDTLLLGGARCSVSCLPVMVTFLDGIIDKILGKRELKLYTVKIVSSSASHQERYDACTLKDDDD